MQCGPSGEEGECVRVGDYVEDIPRVQVQVCCWSQPEDWEQDEKSGEEGFAGVVDDVVEDLREEEGVGGEEREGDGELAVCGGEGGGVDR